jgi:serine/threonine protein kinase
MKGMGSPSAIPPAALLGGKIRLIQRIGRGGMGDVWMARNEATQAEVAVKTLQRSERTPTHDERFRREARLAATISHRNVVRIFDLVDEADGTLGLVMELLRGGTLEACMRERGPLSSMHAVAVAAPILSALNHVHEKGIVHRDVKPANMFFAVEPDGHVIPKILDFGIAKLPAASSPLTIDGSVLGTPHYMAPEQIRGQEDIDGRGDMFSMAAVLYEMVTGVRVFQRDSAAASLAAVLEHEVDPDPRIEPRLWIAISRALAKRPYERFASCAEFADAIRRAVDASEEDFAHALQELRPRSDAIPDTEGKGLGSLSASASSSRARRKPPERRSILWTVAGVTGVALLAISGTLAVTRSSTSRADDTRVAPSASGSVLPAVSIGRNTTPSPSARDDGPAATNALNAVPPPDPVSDVGDLGTTPTPLAGKPPTASSSGASTSGAGSSAGTARLPAPRTSATAGGARPNGTKPVGSSKPVATSPGF